MKRFLGLLIFSIFFLFFPLFLVSANQGVGVGTGKIIVEKPFKSGVIYDLPKLTVLNTGDEEGVFKVGISYKTGQKELEVSKDWIEFSETSFTLKPGEAKQVSVRAKIPLKSTPGDYFCYLEASLNNNPQAGVASVGIAAAAKLYFKVAPSNVFEGIYYRVISLWKNYLPWTNIGLGTIVIFIIISFLRKNINIQVGIKKKEKTDNSDQDNAK